MSFQLSIKDLEEEMEEWETWQKLVGRAYEPNGLRMSIGIGSSLERWARARSQNARQRGLHL